MTAFLKIDNCNICHRALPWEWIPAALVNGKALAGTGVWRSQLVDRRCPACVAALETQRQRERQALYCRAKLVDLLSGEKPCREFTFERYEITPGNRLAYERCKNFNPATENLYLWGACGRGKTHLAYAAARRSLEETLSVEILPAYQISRKTRLKEPDQEQAVLDQFIRADVLLLDDLGAGSDTAYTRQVLQEILDSRDFHDRAGLIVTSAYSLEALARKMEHDAIPSRLAGLCQITKIAGQDYRLMKRRSPPVMDRHYE